NDPCDFNFSQVTLLATSASDCDGDGVTNAAEINGPEGGGHILRTLTIAALMPSDGLRHDRDLCAQVWRTDWDRRLAGARLRHA
ncbi:MAG: hypothetical protein AAF206_20800, partial [Bacteroidota bacterium]